MFFEAFLLGMFLGVAAGPVFFAIIELAIQGGKKPAFSLAAGVWLGDLTFVLMVFFGLSFISEIPGFNFYLGLTGGIILICFGLASILSKVKKIDPESIQAASYLGYFVKGFAINVLNPFVFIFWIGIIGNLTKTEAQFSHGLTYVAIILLTLVFSDLFKIYIADIIRDLMSEKQFKILRTISGLGLIAFGISLIYKVI